MIALTDTFLFNDVTTDDKKVIISRLSPKIQSFSRGEIIYTPQKYENKLGIVLSGRVLVLRHQNNGRKILLNDIHEGGAFGLIALVSEKNCFPTSVVAKTDLRAVFFSKNDLSILLSYPQVSFNLIKFSVEKVTLLNQKIAELSSNDVIQKTARFIISKYKKSGSASMSFSPVKISKELSCGRASLYRAVETLEKEGVIGYFENTVTVTDIQKLEEYSL